MKKRLALLMTIGALIAPASAVAADWSWGYNYLGPNTVHGWCMYYPGAVCSPDGYWRAVACGKTNGDRIHCGFEDWGTIRGMFVDGVNSVFFTKDYVDMGDWVRVEATYWSGARSYTRVNGYL